MANFSGALKITDLNDFIAPSQGCVVTGEGIKPSEENVGGKVGVFRRHVVAS